MTWTKAQCRQPITYWNVYFQKSLIKCSACCLPEEIVIGLQAHMNLLFNLQSFILVPVSLYTSGFFLVSRSKYSELIKMTKNLKKEILAIHDKLILFSFTVIFSKRSNTSLFYRKIITCFGECVFSLQCIYNSLILEIILFLSSN